ncbi:phage portal protein [Polymorphobacter fuscus]|uniref:Phage portal protein n=1 Tax=Sandarakinorhabdus fusca TaxID=1439888 RepID=A0A7C9GM33_9SPHN|nr:phage portal protein [Polymorphobacter fuscus]KAB7648174.1 phage portal protein [Polymorphobacter fuscus]MQT15672.1 phage portal protein [Polymorphobacter fuscus]NJC08057.1 HK97 family phage portal protein [Polymorphobacter fuscus]
MKLPFWRTKSAAPGPRIPTWATPFQSGDGARGYEAQVRDSYLANPVAARAIRLISEGAGGAPLVSNPPGHAALALLASTGFGASGPGLLETLAAQLLLHGNAYVEAATGPDGLPAALFALRPERVTVEADGQGWPAAYLYRAGASVTRYPAQAQGDRAGLLHIRGYHPLDDHYGAGCLGAAAGAVEVHNAAAKWNRALLDNAARPSGALVYQPGDGSSLSPDQFERLRAEMETGFGGAANAGRPMLLEGGLSWQAMSLTPAEMDFARARDTAAREIALAFGVPPLLLGLPGDATYANYKEANVALWRLTLLPLTGRILAALSAHLRHWWPGLEISVDRDAVPALSEDRERLWAQVSAAAFLTDPEKRALLGLEAGR